MGTDDVAATAAEQLRAANATIERLTKELSDTNLECGRWQGKAEMWEASDQIKSARIAELQERLEAAELLLTEVYKQAGNSAPAERRHALTAKLRDDMRDYIKSNCAQKLGWLPQTKQEG